MSTPEPLYQDPYPDEYRDPYPDGQVRPGTTPGSLPATPQQDSGPYPQWDSWTPPYAQQQYAPAPQFGRTPQHAPSPQFGRTPHYPQEQAYYQADPGPQRGGQLGQLGQLGQPGQSDQPGQPGQPGLGGPVAQQGGGPAYGRPDFGVPVVAQVPGPQVPGPLADFGTRMISYLIDYVVPLIVWYIGLIIMNVTTGITALSGGLALVGYLGLLGFTIWNSGYLQGTTGQSIGRRVAKTKLVQIETGRPIGFGMACVRHLCHLVEFGIGFLWPLWDSKRQTFADKIVGTVVIRVDGPTQDRGGS